MTCKVHVRKHADLIADRMAGSDHITKARAEKDKKQNLIELYIKKPEVIREASQMDGQGRPELLSAVIDTIRLFFATAVTRTECTGIYAGETFFGQFNHFGVHNCLQIFSVFGIYNSQTAATGAM